MGALEQSEQLRTLWRERIEQARQARRPFEPGMLTDLAFAAGQHWLVYDHDARRLRHISELDTRYAERELVTADRITEYRDAQLGELATDDDRPQLLTAQAGDQAEDVADELNQACAYAWEHEWHADDALRQARRFCVDLGVAAIRCRWNPDAGKTVGHLPYGSDGQPVTDQQTLAHLAEHGQLPDGQLPHMKSVREGRTCWEPLSALHLLTPPGVAHESGFPWEVVCRPVPLDDIPLKGLVEDTDIASTAGVTTGQQATAGAPVTSRLRGHGWLYTCFQRPTSNYPDGRTILLATNRFEVVDVTDRLDYTLQDGTPHSGVVYLHWRRRSDRFWSGSFISNLKDPQRIINRRETQNLEIIDRGMPKVFIHDGDLPEDPQGDPLELVRLAKNAPAPQVFGGAGPGGWMYEDLAHQADNLSHASTLSPLRLGENPPSVNTYSQLALLNENEQVKRSPVVAEHRQAIGTLIELSVQDIRRYWPDEKQILVTGDQDALRQTVFRKQKQLPAFFKVKIAKGAALPRGQAAELQKVDAVWAAVNTVGLATEDPPTWGKWYADSLEAGKMQPLPEPPQDAQADVARFENFLLQQGETPAPADHDLQQIHVPIHREALDEARAEGDDGAVQRIQQHIMQSVQMIAAARKTLRQYNPADTEDVGTDLALDEDQALRENDLLTAGKPLNPEAMQDALTAIHSGTNPETGGQITPADNVALLVERAALKPTLTENLEVHLDRHGKVIKSALFATMDPAARRRFLTHYDLTRTLWLSIPMMPDKIDPPKVTLSLREEVGPTTTAKILARGGVPEADPNEIATEPVLPNMVQAKVTEPDPIRQPQQPLQQ